MSGNLRKLAAGPFLFDTEGHLTVRLPRASNNQKEKERI